MSDVGRPSTDGGERRRRTWSADQKQRIIAESFAPGASVADVALRYGLNANMLFTYWIESNAWCPRLTAAMILSGSAVQVKGCDC